jgi:hypothetical protein
MDAQQPPEIYCLVAWPLWDGEVILSKQDRVTLEEAETYHVLGFLVLLDPESEQAYHEWRRWSGSRWRQW